MGATRGGARRPRCCIRGHRGRRERCLPGDWLRSPGGAGAEAVPRASRPAGVAPRVASSPRGGALRAPLFPRRPLLPRLSGGVEPPLLLRGRAVRRAAHLSLAAGAALDTGGRQADARDFGAARLDPSVAAPPYPR